MEVREGGAKNFHVLNFLFANTITETLYILFKAKVMVDFYCIEIPFNEISIAKKVFGNLLPNFRLKKTITENFDYMRMI